MSTESNKLILIRQLVEAARNNIDTAVQLLKNLGVESLGDPKVDIPNGAVQHTDQGAVIIEGVFDGQNMVGPDGKLYSVPANYASKSKLVEGDLLKLTISPDGSFIYKQIGPVERDRIVGVLTKDEQTDEFQVLARGQNFRILLASVTYFKGELGDEIVVLVPKGSPSTWAAVENVIKKYSAGTVNAQSLATIDDESEGVEVTVKAKKRGRPAKSGNALEKVTTKNNEPAIEF